MPSPPKKKYFNVNCLNFGIPPFHWELCFFFMNFGQLAYPDFFQEGFRRWRTPQASVKLGRRAAPLDFLRRLAATIPEVICYGPEFQISLALRAPTEKHLLEKEPLAMPVSRTGLSPLLHSGQRHIMECPYLHQVRTNIPFRQKGMTPVEPRSVSPGQGRRPLRVSRDCEKKATAYRFFYCTFYNLIFL